jgi:chorismate synthase
MTNSTKDKELLELAAKAAEIGKGMQEKSTQNLLEDNFYKTEADAFYSNKSGGLANE